jgi:hypothetical protein
MPLGRLWDASLSTSDGFPGTKLPRAEKHIPGENSIKAHGRPRTPEEKRFRTKYDGGNNTSETPEAAAIARP